MRQVDLGAFRVVLETTTLADAIDGLGRGIEYRSGGEGDGTWNLCYVAQHQYVILSADAEMGGPEHSINGVTVGVGRPPGRPDCSALPEPFLPIQINGVLELGGPVGVADRIFGPADRLSGEGPIWEYVGKILGRCEDGGFDVINRLGLRVAHSRIVEMKAWQVSSC